MEKFDFLIVGCGYAGSVLAERIASQLNKKVLIVEKRDHIGGNAFDYYDENGVLVHKYGPHIFHTNFKEVWDYLSIFTEWRYYFHRVLAVVDGKKIPIPFNFNSMHMCFPGKLARKFEEKLIEKYGFNKKVAILDLIDSNDKDLKFLAEYIYEKIFLNYNIKQWGLRPEELDKSVTARVPIFIGLDNRYFQDTYQGVPKNGYTEMFKKMLNHKNIHILLKTDYKEIIDIVKFNKLIYTGPIDYFFDYIYGKLPYRSLKFKFKSINEKFYQEVAQVNFPNEYEFTRITEYKHITGQENFFSTIAIEFPEEYIIGKNEPYYPIPKLENNKIYNMYRAESNKYKSILFLGRLSDYKYYNMDQIVARALMTFKKQISKL